MSAQVENLTLMNRYCFVVVFENNAYYNYNTIKNIGHLTKVLNHLTARFRVSFGIICTLTFSIIMLAFRKVKINGITLFVHLCYWTKCHRKNETRTWKLKF